MRTSSVSPGRASGKPLLSNQLLGGFFSFLSLCLISFATLAQSGARPEAMGPPVVSSFWPISAPIGATVRVSGSNFQGVTAVRFGGPAGLLATVTGSNNFSYVDVIVPVGACIGPISLTTPLGTSTTSGTGTFGSFNVEPVVTSVRASPVGAGGLLMSTTFFSGDDGVVITGSNLQTITSLTIGGNPCTVVQATATQVTAIVPHVSQQYTGQIVISSSCVKYVTPSAIKYIVAPTPIVTAIRPREGHVGDLIQVTGKYLYKQWFGTTKLIRVYFRDSRGRAVTANGITNDSVGTLFTFHVPVGAVTGPISIEAKGGLVAAGTFTVLAPRPAGQRDAAGTLDLPAGLALYPNPAHDAVTVSLPEGTTPLVQLCDALGRVVRTQPVSAGATTETVPLAGLPGGLYFVRCGTQVSRLVVE